MSIVQGSLDPESWMERARAVRVVSAVAQEQQAEARSSIRSEPAAWDPYDVWLHRIHWPRQRRSARQ